VAIGRVHQTTTSMMKKKSIFDLADIESPFGNWLEEREAELEKERALRRKKEDEAYLRKQINVKAADYVGAVEDLRAKNDALSGTIYAIANGNRGHILFRANDNLEKAVVIFENEEVFNRYIRENARTNLYKNYMEGGLSEGDLNIMHSDDFNSRARLLAPNYMFNNLKALYESNKHLVVSQEDVPKDRKYVNSDDTLLKMPPELATPLVYENNEVRPKSIDPNSPNVRVGTTIEDVSLHTPPNMHTHPLVDATIYKRSPDVQWIYGKTYGVQRIHVLGDAPPSGTRTGMGDWPKIYLNPRNEIYSVIATPEHLWFYNRSLNNDEPIKLKVEY
jgi:hypothetical protein